MEVGGEGEERREGSMGVEAGERGAEVVEEGRGGEGEDERKDESKA